MQILTRYLSAWILGIKAAVTTVKCMKEHMYMIVPFNLEILQSLELRDINTIHEALALLVEVSQSVKNRVTIKQPTVIGSGPHNIASQTLLNAIISA